MPQPLTQITLSLSKLVLTKKRDHPPASTAGRAQLLRHCIDDTRRRIGIKRCLLVMAARTGFPAAYLVLISTTPVSSQCHRPIKEQIFEKNICIYPYLAALPETEQKSGGLLRQT